MLSVRYSGPGGHDRNTAPEYFGLVGVAHGPLRKRYSGKGRAVPERLPVDPSPFFASLRSAHSRVRLLWLRHGGEQSRTRRPPRLLQPAQGRRSIQSPGVVLCAPEEKEPWG